MTEPLLPPPIEDVEPPKESTATRIINKFVLLALLAVAATLVLFFTWATADESVLSIQEEPMKVRTIREHPTAGGVVFVTPNYCKNYNVVGEQRLSFVSATREVFLPLTEEDGKKGCHEEEIVVQIPKDIPVDVYIVKMRVTYNINPLKTKITQIATSQPVIIDPTTTQ